MRFFFVGMSSLILPRIRRSPIAALMLDGVIVGSLALMAVVAWQLGTPTPRGTRWSVRAASEAGARDLVKKELGL